MTRTEPQSTASEAEPLQQLLSALHQAGLEPTATELADVLWLAAHLTPMPFQPASPTQAPESSLSNPNDKSSQLNVPSGPETASTPHEARRTYPASRQTAVYPRTGSRAPTTAAQPFRAPAVPMLPDTLALGRALRPLHHKVPSRKRYVLDTEATVDQIAMHRLVSQQFWQPMLTRVPECWFDLALILDYGASMCIWHPLLADIHRLLLYNGAFRTVHVWSLDTNADRVGLHAGIPPQGSRICDPKELLTSDGRRLFLVVSDCISRAWHTGAVVRMLQQWSVRAPLAVLQMLPPRMWSGTALGRGKEIRLYAAAPGVPNAQLSWDSMDFWRLADQESEESLQKEQTLKLPILSLEPDAFLGWANLLYGKHHAWVTGAAFTEATRYAAPGSLMATSRSSTDDIDNRVQRFFAQASPQAQQLAGYLAAAPLTLPVMRLVQQVMLPHSNYTHLAEVFLSGLLIKHTSDETDGEPLYYDFHDGVRERLLDLLATWEAVEVLQQVSAFVVQHTGGSLDFQALLRDPTAPRDVTVDMHGRYFARIGAKVLQRLGGPYARLAAWLEGADGETIDSWEASSESTKPTPLRDNLTRKTPRKEVPAGSKTPLPILTVQQNWHHLFRDQDIAALEAVLPAYLRERHWFFGKARTIQGVQVGTIIPVPRNTPSAYITLINLTYLDGKPETYVLPLAFATGKKAYELDKRPAAMARLHVQQTEEDGLLYDAMYDTGFATGLFDLIARERRINSPFGTLSGTTMHSFPALRNTDVAQFPPVLMRAEQSHTSIVYGEQFILKLYRLVDEGVNPELEISSYLTAGPKVFASTAPVAGAIEFRPHRGEAMTLAILHDFIRSQGDAWAHTLDALGRYFNEVVERQSEIGQIAVPGALLSSVGSVIPPVVEELIGFYLESAHLIGQRTGEMHVALASPTDNPNFAPEPFTEYYQQGLYKGMLGQATQTLQLLRQRLRHLPEGVQSEARKVLDNSANIRVPFRRLRDLHITAMRTRCHGDYHLGQVLYTGNDFVIIDFEGEPARPLSMRRMKRSPIQDIAGMLRSFHYAAYAALLGQVPRVRPEDFPILEPWAMIWYHWVCVAFLQGYFVVTWEAAILPQQETEVHVLLDAYLLEKAVYEVSYELNNRPDWLIVPLRGLLQLIDLRI